MRLNIAIVIKKINMRKTTSLKGSHIKTCNTFVQKGKPMPQITHATPIDIHTRTQPYGRSWLVQSLIFTHSYNRILSVMTSPISHKSSCAEDIASDGENAMEANMVGSHCSHSFGKSTLTSIDLQLSESADAGNQSESGSLRIDPATDDIDTINQQSRFPGTLPSCGCVIDLSSSSESDGLGPDDDGIQYEFEDTDEGEDGGDEPMSDIDANSSTIPLTSPARSPTGVGGDGDAAAGPSYVACDASHDSESDSDGMSYDYGPDHTTGGDGDGELWHDAGTSIDTHSHHDDNTHEQAVGTSKYYHCCAHCIVTGRCHMCNRRLRELR